MPTEANAKTRSRLIGTLFAGNALSSTAFIGVVTVASLIGEQVTGSEGLSGLPNMMGTFGSAAGAGALSALGLRIGRRRSFTFGFALAAFGTVLAAASIVIGSLPVLLLAMAVLGFGRSVSQLARFAAGDLRESDRRASAISFIVWAATIGAVAGPLLLGPTSALASGAGFDPLLGPITVGFIGFGLAAILMFSGLRPEPLTLTIAPESAHPGEPSPLREILQIPTVRLAIVGLMTSQFVMVLIMTMTPLHIRANAGDLGTIGIVMMAHTLGMFAISPITGKLVDRHGPRRILMLAVVTLLVASLIATAAPSANTVILVVGLFLLGVGWNFGFVASSTGLQIGLPVEDRLRVQGTADAITWISGGIGAAMSGVIVAGSSFTMLAMVGAVLALSPVVLLYRTRTT